MSGTLRRSQASARRSSQHDNSRPEPDHRPERNSPPEQPPAPADTGQPGSNRSRAEYAASLRNTGWDTQPHASRTVSIEHNQSAQIGESATSPRDTEPARHEKADQPATRHDMPDDDNSQADQTRLPDSDNTEPTVTRDSGPETPIRDRPLDQTLDDPGTSRSDTPPQDESGEVRQPTDTTAAALTTDQVSRSDYATDLRVHDPWQSTADDSADPPAPDTRLTEENVPADQKTSFVAQDGSSAAGQPADLTAPSADLPDRALTDIEDSGGMPETDAQIENSVTEADAQTTTLPDAENNSQIRAESKPANELDDTASEPERSQPDQLGPSRTEYHEGRPYQITGNPDDGVWSPGMPGDPPGTSYGDPYGTIKIGEYFGESDADAEDEDWVTSSSRKAAERFDDISESVSKTSDAFSHIDGLLAARPGPTIAGAGVSDHTLGAGISGGEQGQAAAHGIEAVLIATIVAAKIWQAMKNRHRTREG